jgi:hypothetical protein
MTSKVKTAIETVKISLNSETLDNWSYNTVSCRNHIEKRKRRNRA